MLKIEGIIDIDEELAKAQLKLSDKIPCTCGELIARSYMFTHQSTDKHLGQLRRWEEGGGSVESKKPEEVMTDDKVRCDCGKVLQQAMMKDHLKTKRHTAHMQRTAESKPALKGTDRQKELIKCECGAQITRSNMRAHLERKCHTDFIAKRDAASASAGSAIKI